MEAVTRSAMIEETSAPTIPDSVKLVAETLTKGAELNQQNLKRNNKPSTSSASRFAVSLFPLPVGPSMRILH